MYTSCATTLILLVSIVCSPTSAFQQLFGATYKGLLVAKGRNIPTITTGPSPNRYPFSVALSGSEPGAEFTPDDPLAQSLPIDLPDDLTPDDPALAKLLPIDLPNDLTVAANNPASAHPGGDKLEVFAASDALRLAHGWSTDRVCSASRTMYANYVTELGLASGVWGTPGEKGDARIAELLLQLGLDPNVRSYRGMFPLYTAAMNDDYALCEALLRYGADKEMSIQTYYGSYKPVDAARDPKVKKLIETWSLHQQHLDEKHNEAISSLFDIYDLDDMPAIDRNALVKEMTDFHDGTASKENHPNLHALSIEVDRKITESAKSRAVQKRSIFTDCEWALIAVLVQIAVVSMSMLGLFGGEAEYEIIQEEVELTWSEWISESPLVDDLRGYINALRRAETRYEQVIEVYNIASKLNELGAIKNIVSGIVSKMSWWTRIYTLAMACGTITLWFLSDGTVFVVECMNAILNAGELIEKVEEAVEECE